MKKRKEDFMKKNLVQSTFPWLFFQVLSSTCLQLLLQRIFSDTSSKNMTRKGYRFTLNEAKLEEKRKDELPQRIPKQETQDCENGENQ